MESWTIGSAIDWTAGYFEKLRIPDARLEAELLLASVLKQPRLHLHTRRQEPVSEKDLSRYKQLILERKQRKPLAYILGEQEFMGLRFKVSRHTLIPRPETELLVEETVRCLKGMQDAVIVDLGTGSGDIPVSIAKLSEARRIFSVDISREALEVAQENINYHGCAGRIVLRQGDFFSALKDEGLAGTIDLVVSNPPYIPEGEYGTLQPELAYEPRTALLGGQDGLDCYRVIARDAGAFLKKGGWLLMELNAAKSSEISAIVKGSGLKVEAIKKDYAGLDRIIIAQR